LNPGGEEELEISQTLKVPFEHFELIEMHADGNDKKLTKFDVLRPLEFNRFGLPEKIIFH
jgi:hypothetical protein